MRHTASHNVPTPAATSRERPTLRTKRLVLRTLSAADAAALFPAYADPDTMRWWSCPPVTDVSALAARLEREDTLLAWTICLDGTAIGRVSLRPHRPGVMEMGYLLARDQWGQGLAREAAGAAIAHGFDALGLRRIYADTDPDNARSIGVLAALGFVLEGRLRAEWETHIGVRDSLIFGLLRSEWAAQAG